MNLNPEQAHSEHRLEFGQPEFDRLCLNSRKSARLRQHLNIHSSLSDSCQRLLIAMQPNSYIRPHIHVIPAKSETFVVLRGRLGLVQFHHSGSVLRCEPLGPNDQLQISEIPACTWHTAVALLEDTVFLEVKAGPFTPIRPEDYATWAPEPDNSEAASYLSFLRGLFL